MRFRPTRSTRLWLRATWALFVMLPTASYASELISTFLTSSTGTTTIEIGDTIQFEVAVTLDTDEIYTFVVFSVTGDVSAASVDGWAGVTWPGVMNNVTDWAWNYRTGKTSVKFPTPGLITPSMGLNRGFPQPGLVAIGWWPNGMVHSGTGNTNVIGTVTIIGTTLGSFEGGGFMTKPDDDFSQCQFRGSFCEDSPTVSPVTFNVTQRGGIPVPALGPIGITILLSLLGATAYWRLRSSPSSV